MALVYATGGSELLIEAWVVDMASKVVTPRATLAGTWNEIGNSFYKKYLSLNYLQSKMEKWLLPNEKQNFFFANKLWNEKKCKIAFPKTNILFENKILPIFEPIVTYCFL